MATTTTYNTEPITPSDDFKASLVERAKTTAEAIGTTFKSLRAVRHDFAVIVADAREGFITARKPNPKKNESGWIYLPDLGGSSQTYKDWYDAALIPLIAETIGDANDLRLFTTNLQNDVQNEIKKRASVKDEHGRELTRAMRILDISLTSKAENAKNKKNAEAKEAADKAARNAREEAAVGGMEQMLTDASLRDLAQTMAQAVVELSERIEKTELSKSDAAFVVKMVDESVKRLAKVHNTLTPSGVKVEAEKVAA